VGISYCSLPHLNKFSSAPLNTTQYLSVITGFGLIPPCQHPINLTRRPRLTESVIGNLRTTLIIYNKRNTWPCRVLVSLVQLEKNLSQMCHDCLAAAADFILTIVSPSIPRHCHFWFVRNYIDLKHLESRTWGLLSLQRVFQTSMNHSELF